MLKIVDIRKKYFSSMALNRVSFNVPEGSITGIIGPNGTGKFTVLDILVGFQNPGEGEKMKMFLVLLAKELKDLFFVKVALLFFWYGL